MVSIAKRVKDLREAHKLTQEQLGEAIGGNKQTIWRLEGGNNPTAQHLVDIAAYFDVSVDYLLGRVDNPHEILSAQDLSPTEQRFLRAIRDRSFDEMLNMITSLMRDEERVSGGAA